VSAAPKPSTSWRRWSGSRRMHIADNGTWFCHEGGSMGWKRCCWPAVRQARTEPEPAGSMLSARSEPDAAEEAARVESFRNERRSVVRIIPPTVNVADTTRHTKTKVCLRS
jgi:hypothetical protein